MAPSDGHAAGGEGGALAAASSGSSCAYCESRSTATIIVSSDVKLRSKLLSVSVMPGAYESARPARPADALPPPPFARCEATARSAVSASRRLDRNSSRTDSHRLAAYMMKAVRLGEGSEKVPRSVRVHEEGT